MHTFGLQRYDFLLNYETLLYIFPFTPPRYLTSLNISRHKCFVFVHKFVFYQEIMIELDFYPSKCILSNMFDPYSTLFFCLQPASHFLPKKFSFSTYIPT